MAGKVVFGALAAACKKVSADWAAELSESGELTGGADRVIGSTERIVRNTLAELPQRLRKRNLRRSEASEYPDLAHGIRYATATLAKMATMGTGPGYYKQGRSPLYSRDALDAWAERQLGSLHSSSSDHALGSGGTGD